MRGTHHKHRLYQFTKAQVNAPQSKIALLIRKKFLKMSRLNLNDNKGLRKFSARNSIDNMYSVKTYRIQTEESTIHVMFTINL